MMATHLLAAAADAFVRDGTYAAQNAGTSAALDVKMDAYAGYNRRAYLRFDASPVSGDVSRAVMRVYGRHKGTGATQVAAFGVAGTAWAETGTGGINWNNKPAIGATPIRQASVGTSSQYYEWDVTAYVRAELAAGRKATGFALGGTAAGMSIVSFNSDESAANRPQLVITTVDGPTAPVQKPGAVGGFAAAAQGTTAALSWQATAGTSGYNIYRAAQPDAGQAQPALTLYRANVTGSTFVDTAVAPEAGYRYAIAAVNSAGEGPISAERAVVIGVLPTNSGKPAITAASTPGLSVNVGGGQVRLPNGSLVNVNPATLAFAAPEIRDHTLVDLTPYNWKSTLDPNMKWGGEGLALKPPADTLILGGLYKGVITSSIVVKNEAGTKTFVRDVDYKLNVDWGQVSNLNGRLGSAQTTKVKVSYKYVTQRIDLIQVRPDGTLSVKRGTPAIVCPTLPAPDAGSAALAGVYVYTLDGPRTSGFTIRQRDIFPIAPAAPVAPINAGALAKTKSKLSAGQPVNIALFGDSITAGAEAGNWWRDRSLTYTGQMVSGLKTRFPNAKITELPAYKGGIAATDDQGMFQTGVIAPYDAGRRADLLVIGLGMNDTGKPMSAFKAAMTNYIRQAKSRGMEVLLVTPMAYNQLVEPLNAKIAPRAEIAQAIRELAAAENVACADVYTEWVNQDKRGVPSFSQLHNWLNHPGVAGHKLYADVILRTFA